MDYSNEEKQERFDFIRSLMTEVRQDVFDRMNEEGANDNLLQRANEEMHVDDELLELSIQYYFEVLMKGFKSDNGFNDDDLANRDKMSAFMALALLTCRPFRAVNNATNFVYTEMVNESLVLRYVFIVLGIDDALDDEGEEPFIPQIVIDYLLLNLRRLGVEARRRMKRQEGISPNEPIMGWVIQSMQVLGLTYGTLDLVETLPPADAA